MSTSKYWIFQANPDFYDLAAELKKMSVGDLDTWAANQYRDEIQPGDQLALWQSGPEAGIYAFGEVVSLPQQATAFAEWQIKAHKDHGDPGSFVEYRLTSILSSPVPRSVLKQDVRFKDLSILKMASGTNFRVTPEQWRAFLDLAEQAFSGSPPKKRNPTWVRDEILLALDVYFQHDRKYLEPHHPAIVELSQLLNSLPIHSLESRSPTFRNPACVAMKIANLMSIDPAKGYKLSSVGQMDREVWEEFKDDPQRVHELAEAIRQGAPLLAATTQDDDEGFPEGKVVEKLHRARERNRKLVGEKIKQVKKATGLLCCEACGFDFFKTYGELGQDFAECHHLKPLSQVGEGKTRLEDLAVVCANCHRMIHRSRPMLTPKQLKARIEEVARYY